MKQILFLLIILTFSQCQSQVDYNRECNNAPPVNRNKKWGTTYWNQEIRIPFIYDKLEGQRGEGSYIAYLDKKAGLIDCDGKEIIPFEYAHLKNWLHPFGRQQGLYVVTKTKQTAFGIDEHKKEVLNDWGIINEDNKTIIPLAYGYLRVIDSDLIVARKDRDSILHFFSGKGKSLYKKVGKNVTKGFNEKTIVINQYRGRPSKMIYRSGKEVLPPAYGRCLWTDEEHSIVGKDGETIIINQVGKQISPDGMINIKHDKRSDFFFSYSNSAVKQRGVFRLGKGIIVEPQYFLESWGEVYFAYDEKGEKMEVLDIDGNQLLPLQKYWTSSSFKKLSLKYKDDHKLNRFYMTIDDQSIKLKGLINIKGDIVLPLKYRTISYTKKSHSIIASTEDGYLAFDPKGNQLLPKAFTTLNFTGDPNVLIVGQKDENLKMQFALVQLDKPDNIKYEYKNLTTINEYCLAAKIEDQTDFYLISPDGNKIGAVHYPSIVRAEYSYFERFTRTPNTKGNLIAVGIIQQKDFGINEKGEAFELVK